MACWIGGLGLTASARRRGGSSLRINTQRSNVVSASLDGVQLTSNSFWAKSDGYGLFMDETQNSSDTQRAARGRRVGRSEP
jgi:hypothetical protein